MKRLVHTILFDRVNFGFTTWVMANQLRFLVLSCLVFLLKYKTAFKTSIRISKHLFSRDLFTVQVKAGRKTLITFQSIAIWHLITMLCQQPMYMSLERDNDEIPQHNLRE